MEKFNTLDSLVTRSARGQTTQTITLGRVVDTNDPQQMGRIKVLCPAWGDIEEDDLNDIPWAQYISPFAGFVDSGISSAEEVTRTGTTAYGMWNIPKVGATALVACLDGDPSLRLWLGCLPAQYTPHTMPHGRYMHEGKSGGMPDGPYDSDEQPIEPLYRNMTQSFTYVGDRKIITGVPREPRYNLEWRTRGADQQAAAVDSAMISTADRGPSVVADEQTGEPGYFFEEDGEKRSIWGQGYSWDQLDPYSQNFDTGFNLDSTTYSWTTPGLHSISMDDRFWNNRLRLRTTSGHQIILDDTNERIYVSTAKGNTWIEMDQAGNIDMYASRNVSVHSNKDINFTTDQTFRVSAKHGIHLESDGEIRLHAKSGETAKGKGDKGKIHIKSNDQIHQQSLKETYVESGKDMHIVSHDNIFVRTATNLDLYAAASSALYARNDIDIKSGGTIYMTGGPNIHFNGPVARTADKADKSNTYESFLTDRVPEHEPWARVMTRPDKTDKNQGNTHTGAGEYSYTDKQVGRVERGEDLERGTNWHR